MKKITYILLLFFVAFVFNNCSEELDGTEDLNYVSFEGSSISVVVNKNSTADLPVKIYSTQVAGTERTFNISIVADESSADAATYTVPGSVTIPANSNEGEFVINVNDQNIGPNGETIVLRLEGDGDVYIGEEMTVTVQLYCPLNIDDFLGDYIISEAGYGDYGTTITADPDVANRVWITNFWDWTNDLVYFDFNPDNGRVTVPEQVVTMGDGGDYLVVGGGTYNACNGTFHLEYQGDVAGTVHDFFPASAE